MAIVTRYFSTTGAGLADGTSWANRAELLPSGNWSSVITGFAFNGSDSLQCYIEGGLTYSCGQQLQSSLFTNPPNTTSNWLFLHGCDSSGNPLTVPDADWLSCDPDFSTSTMPEIQTTSNIRHMDLGTSCVVHGRLIYFSGTAANLGMISCGGDSVAAFDWCRFVNSHSGTSATGVVGGHLSNCVLECSGTSFATVLALARAAFNCRVKGNASASAGTRLGVTPVGAEVTLSGLSIMGCVTGLSSSSNGTVLDSSTVVNCTTGVSIGTTTRNAKVSNCVIVNNTTGVTIPSGGRLQIVNTRLRGNTTNIANGGNNPVDWDVDISAGSDAAEFVDYAARNLRNKVGGVTHGKNIGAGDELATGGSGGVPLIGRGGLVY